MDSSETGKDLEQITDDELMKQIEVKLLLLIFIENANNKFGYKI